MFKKFWLGSFTTLAALAMIACNGNGDSGNDDNGSGDTPSDTTDAAGDEQTPGEGDIRIVFYPNESGPDLADAREALMEIIEDATGRPGEIVTTTDSNIAIGEIENGGSHIAYMGAIGYIIANENNPSVQSAFTNASAEVGLDDASYYSFIAVRPEDAAEYEEGDDYTLAPLEGKHMAFVTNTSASGFQVPGDAIVQEFGLESTEDLLDGAVFESIEFGGTHAVSTTHLLEGNVEVAAFFDADLNEYFTVVEGEANTPGAIYEVNEGASAPFDNLAGEQIQIIHATPVLNAPFVFNHDVLTDDEVEALVEAFTSDEAANDPRLFDDENGWFGGDQRFVPVEDSWYDPIRELGGGN